MQGQLFPEKMAKFPIVGLASFTLLLSAIFLTKKNVFWLIRKGITCSVEKNTLLLPLFHFFKPKRELK